MTIIISKTMVTLNNKGYVISEQGNVHYATYAEVCVYINQAIELGLHVEQNKWGWVITE